jgi:hypothetical protein
MPWDPAVYTPKKLGEEPAKSSSCELGETSQSYKHVNWKWTMGFGNMDVIFILHKCIFLLLFCGEV